MEPYQKVIFDKVQAAMQEAGCYPGVTQEVALGAVAEFTMAFPACSPEKFGEQALNAAKRVRYEELG